MTDLIITDLRQAPPSALGEIAKNLPYKQLLSLASQALAVYARVKEREAKIEMSRQYVKAHAPVVRALSRCLVDQNRCRLRMLARAQDDQACSVTLLLNRTLSHLSDLWKGIQNGGKPTKTEGVT